MYYHFLFQAIGIESEDDILSLGKYFYNETIEKPQEADEPQATAGGVIGENGETLTVDQQDSFETNGSTLPTVVKQELIHPNQVVKVLRKYVEDNRDPSRYTLLGVSWNFTLYYSVLLLSTFSILAQCFK